MENVYLAGVQVRVPVTFQDTSLNYFDPSVVNLNYSYGGVGPTVVTYPPAGVIVRDTTGQYHAVFDTTGKPGEWYYSWYQNGVFVQDGMFTVISSTVR